MGEMAEYYSDREHWADPDGWEDDPYDPIQELIEKRRARRTQDFLDRIWVTRDGQRIKVADMGDDHLINAYRFMCRLDRRRHDAYLARGTHPEELEIDDLTTGWVEQLLEEIERRKLDKELQ